MFERVVNGFIGTHLAKHSFESIEEGCRRVLEYTVGCTIPRNIIAFPCRNLNTWNEFLKAEYRTYTISILINSLNYTAFSLFLKKP